jgi:hypothetical protein
MCRCKVKLLFYQKEQIRKFEIYEEFTLEMDNMIYH